MSTTPKTVYGTSGNDTITVDDQYQYTVFAGAGNDLIKVTYTDNIGGTYVGLAQTLYGGDGTDTIELTKASEWLALTGFDASNGIETIKGDGTGDVLVAAQNTSTSKKPTASLTCLQLHSSIFPKSEELTLTTILLVPRQPT